MSKLSDYVSPGVVTGDDLNNIFNAAKKGHYALPAVNVVGTNSVNAVMEAAKKVNSPVIIQLSNGGGAFYAGKGLSNENEKAAIAGSVSGALHVHQLAEMYGIPVIFTYRSCGKKNYFPGLTVYLMPEKRTTNIMANLCSVHTCLTFQKNHLTKTWKSVPNILKG